MIELAAPSPTVQAAVLVAIVSVEAVAFHVGYGVIESAIGPSVIDTLQTA